MEGMCHNLFSSHLLVVFLWWQHCWEKTRHGTRRNRDSRWIRLMIRWIKKLTDDEVCGVRGGWRNFPCRLHCRDIVVMIDALPAVVTVIPCNWKRMKNKILNSSMYVVEWRYGENGDHAMAPKVTRKRWGSVRHRILSLVEDGRNGKSEMDWGARGCVVCLLDHRRPIYSHDLRAEETKWMMLTLAIMRGGGSHCDASTIICFWRDGWRSQDRSMQGCLPNSSLIDRVRKHQDQAAYAGGNECWLPSKNY